MSREGTAASVVSEPDRAIPVPVDGNSADKMIRLLSDVSQSITEPVGSTDSLASQQRRLHAQQLFQGLSDVFSTFASSLVGPGTVEDQSATSLTADQPLKDSHQDPASRDEEKQGDTAEVTQPNATLLALEKGRSPEKVDIEVIESSSKEITNTSEGQLASLPIYEESDIPKQVVN
jgi:hypothetical protein